MERFYWTLHYSCLLFPPSAWPYKINLLPHQWDYSFHAVLRSPNPKLPHCSAGLCCTIPRLEHLVCPEGPVPTVSHPQCHTVLLPGFLVLPDLQAWCKGSIVQENLLVLFSFIPLCVTPRSW